MGDPSVHAYLGEANSLLGILARDQICILGPASRIEQRFQMRYTIALYETIDKDFD